jgi:drug/metabolite transporter (DMT)-like permease
MFFLILTILSTVAIAAILRWNEGRDGDRFVVAGANYAVAGLLGLLLAPPGNGPVGPGELAFGVVVGLGFVGGFVAMMRGMREIGLAAPTTASRLSTLVPVIGSIALYGEAPSTMQYAGIAVGVVAFIVLGFAQRQRQARDLGGSLGLWLLVAAFAITGCVDLAMKIAHESGSAQGPFLPIVFGTAFLVCVTAVAVRGRPVVAGDVAVGALLGIPNFAASYFLLRALSELEGVIVFPAVNASVVLGATALAIFVWREVPSPLTAVGLGLAACAVILLGLG